MRVERLGLAGQRLGRRSFRSTNILSIDGHTHDTSAGSRRWSLHRSDRVVAWNLPEQFTRRTEERQHHTASVWRFCATATNTNTNTHTHTDANANADANADANTDPDADANTDPDADANTDPDADANTDPDANTHTAR
jgi:hypothetical protein